MTATKDLENPLDRAGTLFAGASSLLLERGLSFARQDDPHSFARVAKWRQEVGGRFQLRVDFDDAAGSIVVRGLVCDADGEALAEVFSVSAIAAVPQ